MWQIKADRSVKKDLIKLKRAGLLDAYKAILITLQSEPSQQTQNVERLIPPYKGYDSRRINIQHRVVYHVDQEHQVVTIWSAWGHYDRKW